jgi:hypothetical protein
MRLSKTLCAVLLTFAVSGAQATLVDFESVTAFGTSSFTVGDVTFTDSMGGTVGDGLYVLDYGVQSDGSGLGVFFDDQSRLQLSFANTYDYLSFDFGNDHPGFGGLMHLDLYLGGTLTGSFTIMPNWDDILNQTLMGTGSFDYSEINYDSALAEVVDNIEYGMTEMPVPEPSVPALLALGLLGMRLARKKACKRHC